MTSDNEFANEFDGDSAIDDVTLPAGSDVVAQIRAHAAQIREDAADEVPEPQVWTAGPEEAVDRGDTTVPVVKEFEPEPEPEPEPEEPADEVVDLREAAESEPGTLLPHDDTVPFRGKLPTQDLTVEPTPAAPAAAAVAVAPARPTPAPAQPKPPASVTAAPVSSGGSLIAGAAPPESSTSFWNGDQPFRASGIDAPVRRRSKQIPLTALIALAIVIIVIASVGIAVAIVSTGPAT